MRENHSAPRCAFVTEGPRKYISALVGEAGEERGPLSTRRRRVWEIEAVHDPGRYLVFSARRKQRVPAAMFAVDGLLDSHGSHAYPLPVHARGSD